ncbi:MULTISPECIES: redox-sensing transcriptional repressor Rex [unclassified Luteococcus]|uniref:redox-sensing transcriptional repressor Rex n=1 Tax=unclassified Luteococcus TaxID=2639923 RepID=UPI00313DD2B9
MINPADQIPEATIARLPGYLRALMELAERGVTRVSSTELAKAAGVQSALLRRDLSHFGSYGTRGVGYEVPVLVKEIGEHVGSGNSWPVMVVGVGNLGRALVSHSELFDPDFRLVALVDNDPQVVGSTIAGVTVVAADQLEQEIATRHPRIVIITTPVAAAQEVCTRVVDAGVNSVLNFAPTTLSAPDGVTVRTVDLGQELHILAFHEARRVAVQAGAAPVMPAQEKSQ